MQRIEIPNDANRKVKAFAIFLAMYCIGRPTTLQHFRSFLHLSLMCQFPNKFGSMFGSLLYRLKGFSMLSHRISAVLLLALVVSVDGCSTGPSGPPAPAPESTEYKSYQNPGRYGPGGQPGSQGGAAPSGGHGGGHGAPRR